MIKYRLMLFAAFLLVISSALDSAYAITLIDNTTWGYYNESIGTRLNFTNPVGGIYMFPGDLLTYQVDPTFNPVPFEPNLSTASAALGNWLTAPSNLNSNWNYQPIPYSWNINDETAIVYQIDAGATGIDNFVIQFGVDNGIFVWLDGIFLNGWLDEFGVRIWEYQISLPYLLPGEHYLQILREDHGGSNGYEILARGEYSSKVPEPAIILLLGAGMAGLGLMRRKLSC